MRAWWRELRFEWARYMAARDLSRRLDRGEVSGAEALEELRALESRQGPPGCARAAGECPHEWVETGKRQAGNWVFVDFRCAHCGATKTRRWAF